MKKETIKKLNSIWREIETLRAETKKGMQILCDTFFDNLKKEKEEKKPAFDYELGKHVAKVANSYTLRDNRFEFEPDMDKMKYLYYVTEDFKQYLIDSDIFNENDCYHTEE